MMKFNIKNTKEYENLLNNRAVTGIIKNRTSISETRQIIDNYFNWLKEKYPTATSSLNNLLKQKEQDLNEAINLQQESRIRSLSFDILEASAKEIREQSRQQLDKLFTQPMLLDFQKVDKKAVENLRIDGRIHDTSDIIFLVNGLIEEVFFNIIPRELEKELNQEPKVELSELPAEWNTKRDELLSSICAKSISIGKVRHLSDLKPVEEAINEKCQELIDIIQGTRKKKESKEPICNKPQHQELQTQLDELKKLKAAKQDASKEVHDFWHKATIIDRKERDAVLREDWEDKLFGKNTLEEVNKEKVRLINLIKEKEKNEKENQVRYEEEIQVEIDKAQSFISNLLYLTAEDSNSLLERLRSIRNESGVISSPAKRHAFLNKNKEDAINKLIRNLQTKIPAEEAIRLINQSLRQEPPLQTYDLGDKYNSFASKLRQMSDLQKINEYENEALIISASLQPIRPVRTRLIKLIDSANRILDSNDNSPEAQQDRERVLNILIELEEFRNSSQQTNETAWLVYGVRRVQVNKLVNPTSGTLYQEVRKRALDRLAKRRELLKKQKIMVDENEFNNYQLRINRANSQELQDQKYENEFLNKTLERQQIQSQIVQPPK